LYRYIQLAPIVPPRIADVALHRDLLARQHHQGQQQQSSGRALGLNEVDCGFLTMDQARRLVPLIETEPRAFDLPVVGVWVSGAANVAHLSVWASCLRFAAHAGLADKVTQKGSFLLALYQPGGRAGPACYDVRAVEAAAPFTRYSASMRCVPGEGTAARFQVVGSGSGAGARSGGGEGGGGGSGGYVGECEYSPSGSGGGYGGDGYSLSGSGRGRAASAAAAAAVAELELQPRWEQRERRERVGDTAVVGTSAAGGTSAAAGASSAAAAWAPIRAPPTAYEAAASAAAARAAAAASLAASSGLGGAVSP
jgi:hypothetical protein